MARNKTLKFAWRSFFAASSHDIWTIITKAIEVAAEEDVSEMRKRRDGIVEQLYRLSAFASVPEVKLGGSDELGGVQDAARQIETAGGVTKTLSSSSRPVNSSGVDPLVDNPEADGDTGEVQNGKMKGSVLERHVAVRDEDNHQNNLPGSNVGNSTPGANADTKPHQITPKTLGPYAVYEPGTTAAQDEKIALCPQAEASSAEKELETAIEEDRKRVQAILQYSSRLSPQNENKDDILQAMTLLEGMNVTVEEIKATEVGKVVGALRKHPAEAVQAAAKHLVKSWKGLVEDFHAITDQISKKNANLPQTEGGLQAPPLDAATLASRNTSLELSQLLEDFTAEDLAAGLEKLSSPEAQTPRTSSGKLSFLSPPYDLPPPHQNDAATAPHPSDKETRERVVADKWHQAAKYDSIRPDKEDGAAGMRGRGEGGAAGGQRNGGSGGAERAKRVRSLDDDDIFEQDVGASKKARGTEIAADAKPGTARRDSSESGLKARTKALPAEVPLSRTPSRPPPALPPSEEVGPRKKTPDLPGPHHHPSHPPAGAAAERSRSRTPDVPTKPTARPSVSPLQVPGRKYTGDNQKPLVKPHSTNNFLDFSDSAKRATAPPRRNPEVRDHPQHLPPSSGRATQDGRDKEDKAPERHSQTAGASEARKADGGKVRKPLEDPASDDDLLDELETGGGRGKKAPAGGGSQSRQSGGGESASETERGLEEEDGFLSDTDSEGDTDSDQASVAPLGPADKLEAAKRRLHEKYLQAENAKKSRTTLVLKAGDLPARKRALGRVEKGKPHSSSLHSKLAKRK